MKPILEARDLSKSFGQRRAVQGASLALEPGKFVVVLGPSGSGKTTLFRCLTRIVEPDAGEIMLDGRDFGRLKGAALAASRRKIGVVFQQFNLVRRLSALDNVLAARIAHAPLWRVFLRQFSGDDEARAIQALYDVGLADHLDQRADTLSGGQQQRVAIARALAQESLVLLADEPVASLDPETATAVLELMRNLTRTSGLAVLCTLHQPQLATRFADRVLTMKEGVLEAEDARVRSMAG